VFRKLSLGLASLGLAVAAACAHPVALEPVAARLDVPMPPPRVVVPPSTDFVDPAPPPASTPAPATAAPPLRTAPRSDKPATPPSTVPPPPESVASPVTPLETTADVSALEAQTRTLLNNAKKDLDRVDKNSLSPDARAQYNRALSFASQANTALKDKNYTYARNMAEKAAALASQLPKTR
jgi:hypothetical protein